MAAKYFTPPGTPPLRQVLERRSIDSDVLSPITPHEGPARCKEVSTIFPCTSASKPCSAILSTYSLENAQVLGSGLWSTVYLVTESHGTSKPNTDLTPPTTPQRLSFDLAVANPKLYAAKVPSRGDARDVLSAEGSILSYLMADPTSQTYIVRFHGLDERNGALIMDAIPQTLEGLMESLEKLDENSRKEEMMRVFPSLSRRLIEGLAWLHSKGIIHGDIKPSNILIGRQSSGSRIATSDGDSNESSVREMNPLYCDFSASIRTEGGGANADDPGVGPPVANTAGGTWEFMAPELLVVGSPNPTQSSDVYALAITLLTFLLGASPFAAVSDNRFMLRHAIKAGDPLRFANDGELKRVRRLTGWEEWLRPALAKNAEARPTAEEWLARLRNLK